MFGALRLRGCQSTGFSVAFLNKFSQILFHRLKSSHHRICVPGDLYTCQGLIARENQLKLEQETLHGI